MVDTLSPRKRLVEQIVDWNMNRLDLFELTMPTEDGVFNGVMRFFYQDELGRYQTKCIRVSSKQKTSAVVEILREKFFPLDSSIKRMQFGIYEHHANGVRRLTNDEFPLLVQLNWSKNDREGKFVMKVEPTSKSFQFCNGTSGKCGFSSGKTFSSCTKRRWSLRRDRRASSTIPRRGPLVCAAAVGWSREKSVHPDQSPSHEPSLNCLLSAHPSGYSKKAFPSAHSSPPDSTFTRTISNPEEVMRRKRQRTLEAKLMQILQHEGPDVGGTLKIYGGQICPAVPYKTLLLSASDSVSMVIRQALNKYGLEDADVNAYCLVMRVRTAADVANNRRGTDRVLHDTESPLTQLFNSTLGAGAVVTFELRPRPPHLLANRPFSDTSQVTRPSDISADVSKRPTRCNRSSLELDTVFASLIELRSTPAGSGSITFPDVHGCSTGVIYPLPVHKGQVCVGTACNPDAAHPFIVTLPASFWPGVEPHHLIIWRPPIPPGITSTMAATEATTRRGGWLACRPCMNLNPVTRQQMYAQVYINNRPLLQTADNQACVYWLSPGDVIRLGTGRRCLKIWPGNGSLPFRFLSKSTLPAAAYSGSGNLANYPEVPKHQRVYDSSLSGSPPSTYENTPSPLPRPGDDTHHPSISTPVTYFSPLLHSPTPHLQGFQSTMDRTSVSSSSSLSSNPVTDDVPSPPRLRGYGLPTNSNIDVHAFSSSASSSKQPGRGLETLLPLIPTAQYAPTFQRRSFESSTTSNTSVSVHVEHLPPFCPIPYSTPMNKKLPVTSAELSVPSPINNAQTSTPSSTSSDVRTSMEQHSPSTTSLDTKRLDDSNRSHRPRSGSTISDRLPCQLAFAPSTVALLLDWIIKHSLSDQFISSDVSHSDPVTSSSSSSSLTQCPLGPAITVYLMLRAIYRQCDRWEMIESKQLSKCSTSTPDTEQKSSSITDQTRSSKIKLATHQLRRRRRELLILLASAVERFESVGTEFAACIQRWHLWSPPSSDSNCQSKFLTLLRSVAAWLSNTSQLLHLVTRDVDFGKTFELGSPLGFSHPDDDVSSQSAWAVVQDQLTDVVQTAFGFLADICVSRLDRESIPNLLSKFTHMVENNHGVTFTIAGEDGETHSDELPVKNILEQKSDTVLQMLSETLDSLQLAFMNPAFVVQLFARLLHRLNARLFNFILGFPDNSDASEPILTSAHVSPIWGSVFHQWIHEQLCVWAVNQGLGVAAECYLQRVSQAADLMLADVSSVENLYNVVVDLVGLNSKQVGWLLTAYQRVEQPDNENSVVFRIPENWVNFVVSGVKLVADRILAEEETQLPTDTASDDERVWDPRLGEQLDLLLPLLLPEDSYPSDNSIPLDASEDPASYDSGISSKPGSSTDCIEPLILVESIRKFLTFAITAGWCRLSVRPICGRSVQNPNQRLHWNVYLRQTGTLSPVSPSNSPVLSSGTESDSRLHDANTLSKCLLGHPVMSAQSNSVSEKQPNDSTIQVTPDSTPTMRSPSPVSETHTLSEAAGGTGYDQPFDSACSHYISSLCSKHQPFTVVVPKVGRSLGLNILAAKSDSGQDLGIYVRGLVPDGGASHARLLTNPPNSSPDHLRMISALQPGDHLLAVNGQSLLGLSQEAAAQLVTSTGPEVHLTVIRNPNMRLAISTSQSITSLVLIDPFGEAVSSDARCPECKLRGSLRSCPINLVVAPENTSQRINNPLLSPFGSIPYDEPPPVPSAIGPILHLHRTHTTCTVPSTFSTSHWTGTDLYQTENSHLLPSEHLGETPKPHTSSTTTFSPLIPSAGVHSRTASVPAMGTSHANALGDMNRKSCLTSASSCDFEFNDSAASQYSPGTSTPLYDHDHTSSSVCDHFTQQRNTFDQCVSAYQVKNLCEQLFTELSIDNPDENSSATSHTRQPVQVDSGVRTTCTIIQPLSRSTDNRTSTVELMAQKPSCTSPLPEFTARSEPITKFVSAKQFSQPFDGPTPCQRTSSRGSRSWGDLPSLNVTDSLVSPPSDLPAVPVQHTSRSTSSGRVLQRRHTTLTTNRFNLGPRPEPPNQGPSVRIVSSRLRVE